MKPYLPATRRRAFTLVEVLVALALLLAGIVAIVQLFPVSLQANTEAVLRGNAVLLAQEKVQEMRATYDRNALIVQEARSRSTPTDPVVWPVDPRLSYSYSGVSLMAFGDTPGDPRDDRNVARVIVRLAPGYDPGQRVLYELRFDQ